MITQPIRPCYSTCPDVAEGQYQEWLNEMDEYIHQLTPEEYYEFIAKSQLDYP